MISIVIPYLHSEVIWDELIFTVRSIDKYFSEDHQIILVGDRHPKLDIPVISCEQIKGKQFSKCTDSIKKMNCICDSAEITEDFVYWYDDIVLLKEINLSFFEIQYFLQNMSGLKILGNSNYEQLKAETYFMLKKNNLPLFNFETHLPKLFNKSLMKDLLHKFIKSDSHLLINSLYCNYYHKTKPVELHLEDSIKAGFYGNSNAYGFGQVNDYSGILKNKTFLNYNNRGLSESLKKYIIAHFYDKSRYEK